MKYMKLNHEYTVDEIQGILYDVFEKKYTDGLLEKFWVTKHVDEFFDNNWEDIQENVCKNKVIKDILKHIKEIKKDKG